MPRVPYDFTRFTARLRFSSASAARYAAEKLNDWDLDDRHYPAASDGKIVIVGAYRPTSDLARESVDLWLNWLSDADLTGTVVSVDTTPAPLDDDEIDELADQQESWTAADELFGRLAPGDYVCIGADAYWVVVSRTGDDLEIAKHFDGVAFSGTRRTISRLDIDQMEEEEIDCGHGRDRRHADHECPECAMMVKMMLHGLMARDVL